MILGIEIVHQKTDPAGDQQKDDADGLASGADVHLEDFEDGFDAKDNADDVNDSYNHDIIIKEFVFPQGKLKHASRCKGYKGANDGDNGKG